MLTENNIKKAKEYCRDDITRIPGYADALKSPQRYEIHHIFELTINGEYAKSHKELKRLGLYYQRPYFELQWISLSEHRSMHNSNRTSTRNPMYGRKGYNNPLFGKTGERSIAWKGDLAKPNALFRRAKIAYRKGEIDETTYNSVKAVYNESKRERRRLKRRMSRFSCV